MGTKTYDDNINGFDDLALTLSAKSPREQDLSEKLQDYLEKGPITLECRIALDYFGEEDYREIVMQGHGDGVVTDEVRLEFPFTVGKFWESVGEVELALEELEREEVAEGYDAISISVYDNGGKTADRYMVVFIYGEADLPCWEVRTASEKPNLPNEVWMHLNNGCGDVPLVYTMGKKLSWTSLPKPLRKVIGEYIAFG